MESNSDLTMMIAYMNMVEVALEVRYRRRPVKVIEASSRLMTGYLVVMKCRSRSCWKKSLLMIGVILTVIVDSVSRLQGRVSSNLRNLGMCVLGRNVAEVYKVRFLSVVLVSLVMASAWLLVVGVLMSVVWDC